MLCVMKCKSPKSDKPTCNGRNDGLRCQIIAAWLIPDRSEAAGDKEGVSETCDIAAIGAQGEAMAMCLAQDPN